MLKRILKAYVLSSIWIVTTVEDIFYGPIFYQVERKLWKLTVKESIECSHTETRIELGKTEETVTEIGGNLAIYRFGQRVCNSCQRTIEPIAVWIRDVNAKENT